MLGGGLTALVYLSRSPHGQLFPITSHASPDHQEHPYAEAHTEGPSSQIPPRSVSEEASHGSPRAGTVSDHGHTTDPSSTAETARAPHTHLTSTPSSMSGHAHRGDVSAHPDVLVPTTGGIRLVVHKNTAINWRA